MQCAAVSVICELAQKNPKNYLSLAPTLFKLMNNSSNNWMLIKIIKLVSRRINDLVYLFVTYRNNSLSISLSSLSQFGALCPLEPRLGKKLVDPLTSLIHSTSAMSLLYECISTVVVSMPGNTSCMQVSRVISHVTMNTANMHVYLCV